MPLPGTPMCSNGHSYRCDRLQELPEAIGNLTALTTLTLAGCEGLTSLPASISALSGWHLTLFSTSWHPSLMLLRYTCCAADAIAGQIAKEVDFSCPGFQG